MLAVSSCFGSQGAKLKFSINWKWVWDALRCYPLTVNFGFHYQTYTQSDSQLGILCLHNPFPCMISKLSSPIPKAVSPKGEIFCCTHCSDCQNAMAIHWTKSPIPFLNTSNIPLFYKETIIIQSTTDKKGQKAKVLKSKHMLTANLMSSASHQDRPEVR